MNDLREITMIKNAKKFLLIGFSVLAIVCVAMVSIASAIIAGKSDNAINKVGAIYMSAMAKQMQEKFDAVVNLRMMELKGIVERHPPETMEYGQDMIEQLGFSVQVRSFVYLGLYTSDGYGETIYGTPVEYDNEETFFRVLNDSSLRVFAGVSPEGEKLLCLLIDANYPMSDGRTSSVMVGAIPMDYLKSVLSLDEKDSLMYSYIIRRDGTYVVRTRKEDSYFNFFTESFSEYNGKTAEEYAAELQNAINTNTDYETTVQVNGQTLYLLCTHLPDSEWYLISVMPFGTLDKIMKNLSVERQAITLILCITVLIGVLIIFIFILLLFYAIYR